MLITKYGDNCGVILGGDRNEMDISPILNTALNLKQIVHLPTRKGKILDVCITNLHNCYKSPAIIPSVSPDDDNLGVPSDHSVPLCIPHSDPSNRPQIEKRTVVFRPMPDSKLRDFGQWITSEKWDEVKSRNSPDEMVAAFEEITSRKLNEYLPSQTVTICPADKPFITKELKILKRKRMREYASHGKSEKYMKLKEEFDVKFLKASKSYMVKNVENLKNSNPAKAYKILKRLGSRPGEQENTTNLKLPVHEKMSAIEAANSIAKHFSKISMEFPPLDVQTLPDRVISKIRNPESASAIPVIEEFHVHVKIKKANKPKSGVPGDLPRKIIEEFGPELSSPMCTIFNQIVQSSKNGPVKWPESWKMEYGTPLPKTQNPKSEDDLRVISLTSFFSKVLESFVVDWLRHHIGKQLDPKQYGGSKGDSTAHYMIELVNFILYNQDFNEPVAVLLCTIDFAKAFNRINHNIVIEILSDMGVPGWLLNVVMGFLMNRQMVVRYCKEVSDAMLMPGGSPQGTLLGLLMFIVLINACGDLDCNMSLGSQICSARKGFQPSTFYAKFVDDMSIAEAISTKDSNQPRIQAHLHSVKKYAEDKEMKFNLEKTSLMSFNPTKSVFQPKVEIGGKVLETVNEMKILGFTLSNNLSWKKNTQLMVAKAFKKLWMVKRLLNHGTCLTDLTDIYTKHIRSLLEYGTPVWNSALTKQESIAIERVQKVFLHMVLGKDYENYENALEKTGLSSLSERRETLCKKFAIKAQKNPKHSHWFVRNCKTINTRNNNQNSKSHTLSMNDLESLQLPT